MTQALSFYSHNPGTKVTSPAVSGWNVEGPVSVSASVMPLLMPSSSPQCTVRDDCGYSLIPLMMHVPKVLCFQGAHMISRHCPNYVTWGWLPKLICPQGR